MPKSFRGFTLIELLVVIAIISILSVIGIVIFSGASENAKVSKVVSQVNELKKLVYIYNIQTNAWPTCRAVSCTAANDPFLNNLGIPGWSGPYVSGDVGLYNRKHDWGGHLGIQSNASYDCTAGDDVMIVLDDDAPVLPVDNNIGRIPKSAMQKIDKIMDDGNLNTGNVRGVAPGESCAGPQPCDCFSAAQGETVIKLQR